jgi:heat shock protein HslJ
VNTRIPKVAVAVLLALLTVACAQLQPPPKRADPQALLEGTRWQLQQLGSQTALDAHRPTLSFDATGMASGSGSCNGFTAAVTVNGKSITFGALARTEMACTGALNAQEAGFFKALQDAQWFTMSASTLTVYTKALDLPLVFAREAPK